MKWKNVSCLRPSSNYDNKSKLLEKQLTRNILAAKVISTTGHLEENRSYMIQTIQRSIEKLQKDRKEYLNLKCVNSVEDVEVKLKHSTSVPKLDNGQLKRKISPAHDVIKPKDEKCAKKDIKEDVEVLERNKQDDEYVECDVEFEECVVDGKTMYKCFRCEKMFIKTELLSDHYILEHTLLKSGFQD